MKSLIHTKSREFAIRIIGCYKYLIEEQLELVMSKQLLRCGTSIGANTKDIGRNNLTKKIVLK